MGRIEEKSWLSSVSRSGHFNLWMWSDDFSFPKIHLPPEHDWMTGSYVFSSAKEQIFSWHGYQVESGHTCEKWPFRSAKVRETEFYWLSARCFSRWETSSPGGGPSTPPACPIPAAARPVRKHGVRFPTLTLLQRVCSEKRLICVPEGAGPPAHTRTHSLGEWNQTKHQEVTFCHLTEYALSNTRQLCGSD